jgi:hypothetical protein
LRLRRKASFVSHFKPVGGARADSGKIYLYDNRKSCIDARIPPIRGALRDRHETWAGMRWTRRQRQTSAAGAYGEIVRSRSPDAGIKPADDEFAGDGG